MINRLTDDEWFEQQREKKVPKITAKPIKEQLLETVARLQADCRKFPVCDVCGSLLPDKMPCQTCLKKAEADEERIRGVLGETMRRFWGCRFDNYEVEERIIDGVCDESQRKVVDCVRRFAEGKRGEACVLIGKEGTGKTHLACAVIRWRVEHGSQSVAYWRMSDLLRRIAGTWGPKKARSEERVLAEIVSNRLLVLDEIEDTPKSEWERNVFVPDLVDKIYGSENHVMLVGNLDEAAFAAMFPAPTLARLRAMADGFAPLLCAWDSSRQPNPKVDDELPF